MALWPPDEPSRPNTLKAHHEYWIQGAPVRGRRPRVRWWWTTSVVFLGLIAGVAYYLPVRPTWVADPATIVATGEASAPDRTPITASSTLPTPKLVVGLHPLGEPPEPQRVDHAHAWIAALSAAKSVLDF